VELDDVVSAHLLAMHRAAAIGLGRYIIGATTPFTRHEHTRRGWQMFPDIDRMYVNELARRELGWSPRYDFHYVLERLCRNEDPRSPLAQAVGSKRCHRK
jgi:UDP-glucose 4-epimerase